MVDTRYNALYIGTWLCNRQANPRSPFIVTVWNHAIRTGVSNSRYQIIAINDSYKTCEIKDIDLRILLAWSCWAIVTNTVQQYLKHTHFVIMVLDVLRTLWHIKHILNVNEVFIRLTLLVTSSQSRNINASLCYQCQFSSMKCDNQLKFPQRKSIGCNRGGPQRTYHRAEVLLLKYVLTAMRFSVAALRQTYAH